MSAVPVLIGARRPPAIEEASDAASAGPLVDTFGRVHRDLRVSLTDRCSLRCTYCMPEQGNEWLARSSILTVDEIEQIARVAAAAGVTTFRLTGGEPLLRTDIVDVVRRLAAITGPDGEPVELAMTTNGIRLPEVLPGLIEAGLGRLNISLDTLRRDRFRDLTRRDRLDDVLAGIAAAAASGLRPLKLNAVAMRDVNDDELIDLVQFALDHDAELRFIEQMPLDAGHTWDRSRMVTRDEILDTLSTQMDAHAGAWPGRRSGGALDASTADRTRWASSPRSRRRSAATATGCASPPTASCATASSPRPSSTSCRCCAATPTTTSTRGSIGCCGPAFGASSPGTRSTTPASSSPRGG